MKNSPLIKGRGAQSNHPNRFLAHIHEHRSDFLEYCQAQGESVEPGKTQYLPIYPKSIVNEVKSPDLRMDYSMNTYQGCEHGCIYCYARNTHEYWGYSAGLDFERRILVKSNAAQLLENLLKQKTEFFDSTESNNRWVARLRHAAGEKCVMQPTIAG